MHTKTLHHVLLFHPILGLFQVKIQGHLQEEIKGILKQSQNLINLVALSQELISSTPAKTSGLFAIIPTELPSNLANPIMIFFAQNF